MYLINHPFQTAAHGSAWRLPARRVRSVCQIGCCCYCCNVNFCALIAFSTRKKISLSLYRNCCHPLPFAVSSVFSSLFFWVIFLLRTFFSKFSTSLPRTLSLVVFLEIFVVAYIHIYCYRQSGFNTLWVSSSRQGRVW